MIDKIVYITLLKYVRQKKFFRFPERAAGVIVFLPKVLAALSVLHLFVGEDGFVQYQNTTEQVIASIPLVVLILNTLYIWRFSDHEEKIAALKEKEKEVLDQIHDAEMESIRQTMEEKGLDVDALKKILDCYEADSSKDEAN